MKEEKIQILHIGKQFAGKAKKADGPFTAIQDVNLSVKEGEFLSIVGPSGCGKSTLLDLLAGLERPTEGEILIDGETITGPNQEIGIVLQGYALFPWRTVRRNVEFGLEMKEVGKKERREISSRFIELVGLRNFENHYPHELSGGMRQRVAIARALAYDPKVLLMDEPFAAVDAQTREALQEELLQIWEKTGKTVIFITHSIDEAIFLSDRVAVMSSNPGTVKEIIPVSLPRPRSSVRSSEEFSRYRNRIRNLLENQTLRPVSEEAEETLAGRGFFHRSERAV